MNPIRYRFTTFPFPVIENFDDLDGPYFDAVEREGIAKVVVKVIGDAPTWQCKSTGQLAPLIRTIKERAREEDGTFTLTFEDTLVVEGKLIREWDESDWAPLTG